MVTLVQAQVELIPPQDALVDPWVSFLISTQHEQLNITFPPTVMLAHWQVSLGTEMFLAVTLLALLVQLQVKFFVVAFTVQLQD